MNMFKKNGGFTLVELIVVIAILAILAGIAVPAYSGYINKAHEAADYTLLDSVKTAAFFAAVEKHPEAIVEKIEVTFSGEEEGEEEEATDEVNVTITFVADSVEDDVTNPDSYDISAYVGTLESKSGASSATWTSADGWDLKHPNDPTETTGAPETP